MINTNVSPWPCYTHEEAEAVRDILLSNRVNYWTGDVCRKFETEFADFTNAKFAVALANGTVALDAALKALQLAPNDEVVVTSRTFLATVSSVINEGLCPIFADVDRQSQNITAATIEEVMTNRTRAIICVHLAGWPCDMDPILDLAKKHNLYVIEDCAQAHGAKYKGRSVGSIGDIGCWSFCQDKIMSTGGEGGMVTTNDKALWLKMWSYKDHGKNWEAVYERTHPDGFRWLHDDFGTNWRMTEMQAAIGRIQIKKMPDWHRIRNEYMQQIWSAARETSRLFAPKFYCDGCSGSCLAGMGCNHAAYKCYVFVNGCSKERDRVMNAINSRGVPCFQGSCSEVYLEKAFDNTGYRPKTRLPTAKLLGETSLMFLCHPSLSKQEIEKTCSVIRELC